MILPRRRAHSLLLLSWFPSYLLPYPLPPSFPYSLPPFLQSCLTPSLPFSLPSFLPGLVLSRSGLKDIAFKDVRSGNILFLLSCAEFYVRTFFSSDFNIKNSFLETAGMNPLTIGPESQWRNERKYAMIMNVNIQEKFVYIHFLILKYIILLF